MIDFLKFERIVELHNNIAIVCHIYPDADAFGAMFALDYYFKKKYSKKSYCVCFDIVNPNSKIFTDEYLSYVDPKTTLVIFVDCSALEMSGFKKLNISGRQTVNIDHHITNENFADYNFVLPVSSTCEIVYDLFKMSKEVIPKKVAEWLMAGIYFDTGGLKHSNTSGHVLRIVKDLESSGANRNWINKELFKSCSYRDLIMFGRVFNRLKINTNHVLSSLTSLDEIQEVGASKAKVKQVIDLMNQIQDKKVSLLGIEEESKIKFSLRSEDNDVSKIAQLFEGGGHKKASGFSIDF